LVWRLFRKSPGPKADVAWWQAADAAAEQPTADAIDVLAGRVVPNGTPDEVERQDEMITGLRELAALAALPALPVLSTQHRVIGQDQCHLIAPVSLGADAGGAGKLFLTSARLVFVGGRVRSWPWHRVRKVARIGRDLNVLVAGEGEGLLLQCNTFGEALMAEFVIKRLASEKLAP
jgi:hypothetical protein